MTDDQAPERQYVAEAVSIALDAENTYRFEASQQSELAVRWDHANQSWGLYIDWLAADGTVLHRENLNTGGSADTPDLQAVTVRSPFFDLVVENQSGPDDLTGDVLAHLH